MDLTQVEGLGDLIHAETEMQRRLALRQMDGQLTRIHKRWRNCLVKLLANMEAFIDFSESEDIEDGVDEAVHVGVSEIVQDMKKQLMDARAGERLRNGVHLAIVGEPNVGKSSLLNLLSRRNVAIVSPKAGTTRDLLESSLDIGGYPVLVVDTAGLRPDAGDDVEEEGMRRALENAKQADLVLVVLDANKLSMDVLGSTQKILKEAEKLLVDVVGLSKVESNFIVFVNKIDMINSVVEMCSSEKVHYLSCKTNEGLEESVGALKGQVARLCHLTTGEEPSLTRQRHVNHVRKACHHLEDFLEDQSGDAAIKSQHLRLAIKEIGGVAGMVSSEQILDVIFADFCIGK